MTDTRPRLDIVTGGTPGLIRDAEVLTAALSPRWPVATHVARVRNLHLPHRRWLRRLTANTRFGSALTIFSESLPPGWMGTARTSVLIPNQEWIRGDMLRRMAGCAEIWCKSHHAEAIFSRLGFKTRYIGFTSCDLHRPDVGKDYGRAIHVAGRSPLKGTHTLLKVWSANPHWPELLVVSSNPDFQKYRCPNIALRVGQLTQQELVRLMNERGIHLCPSEAEGFGHYIAEGLSTQAVVITVDAPPMNELVRSDYGLLARYERREALSQGERFFVSAPDLQARIAECLAMPLAQREVMGRRARAAFLARQDDFRRDLLAAVERLVERQP